MQPPHQQTRINLAELRAQIVKKLGPEGSKQYFYYLNRFLSLKLGKAEFDKLCHIILGRDNIKLHNHFIRSILKNACSAKAPPPASSKDSSADGYLQNGPYTNMAQVMLPVSPRKARTGAINRKIVNCRNALGSNAQASFATPYTRSNQHAESENGISGPTPADMSLSRRSQDGLGPIYNSKEGSFVRSPLQAPLGVPVCPVSIGGAHRRASFRCNDSLLDSPTLREQMEQIATSHGLEGVSLECANMLNHGLDSYIKGLLKSCIQLVGANLGNELPQNNIQNTHKQLTYMKPINGGFQYQMRNSVNPLERKISLQDFRVAMEMSPSQLGEDWPLLLEKICANELEE